jgi:hypothetical protein
VEQPTSSLTGRLVAEFSRGFRRRSSLTKAHAARDLANAEGRGGGKPKGPEKGAVGIAGLRADLMDGSLPLHQLQAMPLSQIARRYRVSIEHAGRMKRKTLDAP